MGHISILRAFRLYLSGWQYFDNGLHEVMSRKAPLVSWRLWAGMDFRFYHKGFWPSWIQLLCYEDSTNKMSFYWRRNSLLSFCRGMRILSWRVSSVLPSSLLDSHPHQQTCLSNREIRCDMRWSRKEKRQGKWDSVEVCINLEWNLLILELKLGISLFEVFWGALLPVGMGICTHWSRSQAVVC